MSDRWGAKTPVKKCHQRKSRRKKNNAQKSQYNKGTDQQASTSRGIIMYQLETQVEFISILRSEEKFCSCDICVST